MVSYIHMMYIVYALIHDFFLFHFRLLHSPVPVDTVSLYKIVKVYTFLTITKHVYNCFQLQSNIKKGYLKLEKNC